MCRWPGQVADPEKAAERHLALRKPSTLLVYFFGDRSFGWFQPDTLAPFEELFEQLSKVKTKQAVRLLCSLLCLCPSQDRDLDLHKSVDLAGALIFFNVSERLHRCMILRHLCCRTSGGLWRSARRCWTGARGGSPPRSTPPGTRWTPATSATRSPCCSCYVLPFKHIYASYSNLHYIDRTTGTCLLLLTFHDNEAEDSITACRLLDAGCIAAVWRLLNNPGCAHTAAGVPAG